MGCRPKIGKRKLKSKQKQTRYSASDNPSETTVLMPRVPAKCFNCGASIHTEKVNWTGPDRVQCPFCGSNLTVEFEKVM